MSSNPTNAELEQLRLPFFPVPLLEPRAQSPKIKKGPAVHLINNPSKDGAAIIISGAYTITFIKNRSGKVVKTGFSIEKQVLEKEDMNIPSHLFKPAQKLAYIVLTDHENRRKRNSRKKSMF